jgi:hypothetical protein
VQQALEQALTSNTGPPAVSSQEVANAEEEFKNGIVLTPRNLGRKRRDINNQPGAEVIVYAVLRPGERMPCEDGGLYLISPYGDANPTCLVFQMTPSSVGAYVVTFDITCMHGAVPKAILYTSKSGEVDCPLVGDNAPASATRWTCLLQAEEALKPMWVRFQVSSDDYYRALWSAVTIRKL